MGIIQFSEYREYVILAYERLRDKGDLPSNLKRLTPARLKKEWLFVLADKDRHLEKDIDTLRSFFGPKNDLNEYSKAINKFGADKCRPLNKFLKNEERGNTDEKNIELLALLINFKPRPFIYGVTAIDDDEPAQDQTNTDDPDKEKAPEPPTGPPNEGNPNRPPSDKNKGKEGNSTFKKAIFTLTILAFVTSGGYLTKEIYERLTKVYICDSPYGQKYHYKSDCAGLKICGNQILEISIADAKAKGKTLCRREPK